MSRREREPAQPELTDPLKRTIVGVHRERGEAWIAGFGELLRHCEERWGVRWMKPYPPSYHFVAPVVLRDGTEAALKLGVPGKELLSEVETLRLYAGEGAVRLLDAEPERGILLLERLQPGRTLHSVSDDEEAVAIAAGVMRKIARPAPSSGAFPSTADWARGLDKLRAHFHGGTGPIPERLVERAEKLYASLHATMRHPLLLHGDLHHGNMLSAEREPWLAIDPKGVVGEAEFGVVQFLLNHLPASPVGETIARRIAQFAKTLGLDPSRIVSWTFCHTTLSAWWHIEDSSEGFEEALQMVLEVEDLLG